MIRPLAAPSRIGYFGKLPACSDFLKAADDVPLMGVLDDWLAQVMSALPAEARWKLYYDVLAPVHFAFVGPRRKHAIAGHIVASRDQSGRRFPFLMMRTVCLADPAAFVAHGPLALDPLWHSLAAIARALQSAADPAIALGQIPDTSIGFDDDGGAALAGFLERGTVNSLTLLLGQEARHMILALGMLLQPVMHSGAAELEKSLVLPLPEAVHERSAVAAFWMALIAPFLGRADFELALFITRIEQAPVLVVGFRGASAQTLLGIIDPLVGREQQVSFADTGWVDEQLGADVDVRALASYLDQPQLPLTLALTLFLQAFVGAAP